MSALKVDVLSIGRAEEVRSEVEWAQVRALTADGVSKRQIAERLGINRRAVDRLADSPRPPRYERAPTGSMLDRFEPVLRQLLEEWPEIKAPRVTEVLRATMAMRARSTWSRSALRGCARARCAQRRRLRGFEPGPSSD